jgi:hypothetical protein
MTKEQREAIKSLNEFANTKYGAFTAKEGQTVLSMLQEQQEENKKKDKIIDLMTEHIVSSAIVDDTVCAIKCDCETDIKEDCTHEKILNCTKQYFKSKAEKEYRR